MRHRLMTLAAALAVLVYAPSGAMGQEEEDITPFERLVNQSIDNGLQWLRNHQAGNARIGRSTGLATLAFLEKRESADRDAPQVGYLGMDLADQVRVRQAVRYMIESDPALNAGRLHRQAPAGRQLGGELDADPGALLVHGHGDLVSAHVHGLRFLGIRNGACRAPGVRAGLRTGRAHLLGAAQQQTTEQGGLEHS